MKILKLLLVLPLIICINRNLAAQGCTSYHRQAGCSQASEAGFVYNAQSKSGSFATGSTSTVKVIFYKGITYSISICADKSLGNHISWMLKDSKTGEILYDNANDNNATHMEFSCEIVRAVSLIFSIPKTASGKVVTGCLGALIEQKPTAN